MRTTPSTVSLKKILQISAAILLGGKGLQILTRQWRQIAMKKGLLQPETRAVRDRAKHDLVYEASNQSFPASDPPAFSPGTV